MSALPRENRLRYGYEFKSLFTQGKKLHGRGFSIHYLKRESGPAKLGVAVNRKVANAVGRNRIKRVIRESFRQHCFNQAVDVVVVAKRNAGMMSNPHVFSELQGQWKRIQQRLKHSV